MWKASKPGDRETRPPLQRMLHIHAALQSGQFPNAQGLGGQLEVSARTISRDIEFMRDRLDLPIDYNPAKYGFYYTQEVGAFPSLQISEGELFALVVAEKALQQYRGTTFEAPLVSAFKKISQNLPDAISFNMSEWDQSISFRTSAEPILNLPIFDTLARAAAKRTQLRLLYRKAGGRVTEERVVDPYHLANVNGEWFLFAHDHLRGAIRTFVPARMISAVPTGVKFQRPAKFSVERQLRNSFGVHSGHKEYDVVIRFDESVADYVREKKWHASQQLKTMRNGMVELRMRLSSLAEVQRWILSWSGHARVIAPRELAAEVKSAASLLLKTHS